MLTSVNGQGKKPSIHISEEQCYLVDAVISTVLQEPIYELGTTVQTHLMTAHLFHVYWSYL